MRYKLGKTVWTRVEFYSQYECKDFIQGRSYRIHQDDLIKMGATPLEDEECGKWWVDKHGNKPPEQIVCDNCPHRLEDEEKGEIKMPVVKLSNKSTVTVDMYAWMIVITDAVNKLREEGGDE